MKVYVPTLLFWSTSSLFLWSVLSQLNGKSCDLSLILSKLVTSFGSKTFLVFSKEILENLILFQVLRIPEIQNFPLEIVDESSIFLLPKFGIYVKTDSERSFYISKCVNLLEKCPHGSALLIKFVGCSFVKITLSLRLFPIVSIVFSFCWQTEFLLFQISSWLFIIFVVFTQNIRYLQISYICKIEEIKIKDLNALKIVFNFLIVAVDENFKVSKISCRRQNE